MSVLLPLYTYPSPGVWDPIYWEANKNPTLNITVILNPCSGPCMDGLPPTVYIDEVPKLGLYPNIQRLGYVATNYTNKPLESVTEEIRQWGAWGRLWKDGRMGVDGIFFDETPGLYDWQKHDYLKAAADEVRKAETGLGRGIVVHNPGTLPDATWNYLDIANITVVFEDQFANFITASRFNAIKNLPKLSGYPTTAFSILLHSMGSIPDELIEWTAKQMKTLAGWNYATEISQVGEWWHSFPQTLDAWMTRYVNASIG